MNDLGRQASMDRRRGPEPYGRIDIVDAQLGRPGGEVRNAGFHADTVTLLQMPDLRADLQNDARGLVAQYHRLVDHEGPDLSMGIIVDIGAANADGADSDQHVGRRQIPPDRDVAQRQLPLLFKYKRLCHYPSPRTVDCRLPP